MNRTVVAAIACLLVSGCAAEVAQTSTSPNAQLAASATPTPSQSPEETAVQTPEPTQSVTALEAGTVLRVMVDGLRMRAEPDMDGELVDTLSAGEEVGAVGGPPVTADELTWYEVRQGPGGRHGWVASGEAGDWLRVVRNGRIATACGTCVDGSAGTITTGPDGSDQRLLLDHQASVTWSPDGSLIAVVTATDSAVSLSIRAADGTEQVLLPAGSQPAWSPDGTRLVYVDANTGEVSVRGESGDTTSVPGPGYLPVWSPDGQQIAFVGTTCAECRIDPPSAIFVADASGGAAELLVDIAYNPEWSPDGDTVAFGRLDYLGPIGRSYLQLPAAGGDPEPIPGVPAEASLFGFAWSPDGTRIAFGGPEGIVVANADGTEARLIGPHAGTLMAQNPRWSPDGRLVTYIQSDFGAPARFIPWVVGTDGTDPHRLADESRFTPDWQPLLEPLP